MAYISNPLARVLEGMAFGASAGAEGVARRSAYETDQELNRIRLERAQAAEAAQAGALQAVQRRMAAGVGPREAIVQAFQAGELGAAMSDPNFMEQIEGLSGLMSRKAPTTREFREGAQQVTQEFNEGTGLWTEVARGAAFAPAAPPAIIVNTPGDTRRQQLEAERVFQAVPDEQRSLRDQVGAIDTMARLIESGSVDTGTIPTAVKTFVQQRWGIDLGQAGGLQAFQAAAQGQALAAAQQLKGALSDKDVQFLQSLSGNVSRSPAANAAVLKVQRSLVERRQRELDLEAKWYEDHGGTLAGFDQWVRSDAARAQLGSAIPDSVMRSVQAADLQGRADLAKTQASLAQAIEKGSREMVDAAIGALNDDELKALPQEVRDRALAILEGK